MKKIISAAVLISSFILVHEVPAGSLQYGEFRLGGHGNYINPADSDFEHEFGYGITAKYKFTDTLGIEIGGDYFRWNIDQLTTMPFGEAPGPVYYKEEDKVFPIYFTALIYAPYMEQDGRAYLGLGGGYYEVDATIEGNYTVTFENQDYPITIDGDVDGQFSFHIAAGADFMLSKYIYLNAEVRYVVLDLDREQTHSTTVATPTGVQEVTVKDEADFNNWQFRLGLEYAF